MQSKTYWAYFFQLPTDNGMLSINGIIESESAFFPYAALYQSWKSKNQYLKVEYFLLLNTVEITRQDFEYFTKQLELEKCQKIIPVGAPLKPGA